MKPVEEKKALSKDRREKSYNFRLYSYTPGGVTLILFYAESSKEVLRCLQWTSQVALLLACHSRPGASSFEVGGRRKRCELQPLEDSRQFGFNKGLYGPWETPCFASVWEAKSRFVGDAREKIFTDFTSFYWPSLASEGARLSGTLYSIGTGTERLRWPQYTSRTSVARAGPRRES